MWQTLITPVSLHHCIAALSPSSVDSERWTSWAVNKAEKTCVRDAFRPLDQRSAAGWPAFSAARLSPSAAGERSKSEPL